MKNTFTFFVCLCLISCSRLEKPTDNSALNSDSTAPAKLKEIPEKITFPSKDGLTIHANLYHKDQKSQVILFCHQARFNKFEYTGIAKKLHEKGFNCVAIDQRSGGGIVEEINETNEEALKKKLPVDFLDAKQDIEAAIDYVSKKYDQPIILWGSSCSSALSLYIGCENPNVKAIIAFSPGNYFDKELGALIPRLQKCEKPFFITSSKEEVTETKQMLADVKLKPLQIQFIPDSDGFHGSRALWRSSTNNEEYWKAIDSFLSQIK